MSLGTLYSNGHLCPFTHRILVAVGELEAPVEVIYGKDIPQAVRDQVPEGGWPVFIPSDGGDIVRGSSDVVDYLIANSAGGGETYRSDPKPLAALDGLIGCIRKVIMAGKPAIQNEFRGKLDTALANVDAIRSASNGPFLEGEDFTQAEGHIVAFLQRLPFLVEIRDHIPEIFLHNDEFNAWVDRTVNRPSFQAVAPKRHVLRQFYAKKAKYGKPMKVGRLHHSGFRAMWNDLAARTSALAAGDDSGNGALQEARDLCFLLFRAVSLHAKFENLVLFPVLDAATGNTEFTRDGVGQHDHEEGEMNDRLAVFDRAIGAPPDSRAETLKHLETEVKRAREGQIAHLDYEEATFLPVLAELEVEQHLEMLRGAYEMCILERPHLIGVLASYMPIENTLSLLDSLLHAVKPDSEQWRLLLIEMHSYLSPEQWLRVVRRFEDVLPTSLIVVPAGKKHGDIGSAARALHDAVPVARIEIPRA